MLIYEDEPDVFLHGLIMRCRKGPVVTIHYMAA